MEDGRARLITPVASSLIADYFAGVYQWPGCICARGTRTPGSPVGSQVALGEGLCAIAFLTVKS